MMPTTPQNSAADLIAEVIEDSAMRSLILQEPNMIDAIVNLLGRPGPLQGHMAPIMATLSQDSARPVQILVDHDALRALFCALGSFKQAEDDVLHDQWGFSGEVFQFGLVRHCLCALNNIARVGQHEASMGKGNPFVDNFDLAGAKAIWDLLSVMVEAITTNKLHRWRTTQGEMGQGLSIEDSIKDLLEFINAMHTPPKNKDSQEVIVEVAKMLTSYQAEFQQAHAAADGHRSNWDAGDMDVAPTEGGGGQGLVRVRAVAQTDDGQFVRTAVVGEDITVEGLLHIISNKFGSKMMLNANIEGLGAVAIVNNSHDNILKQAIGEMRQFHNNVLCLEAAGAQMGQQMDRIFNEVPKARLLRGLARKLGTIALDRKQMEGLHNYFFKLGGGGEIDREQFKDGMLKQGPYRDEDIDVLWTAFDRDASGTISFTELVTGMAVLAKGRPEDKMRMAFRAFDLDNSGEIDSGEMFQFVKAVTGYNDARSKTFADSLLAYVWILYEWFGFVALGYVTCANLPPRTHDLSLLPLSLSEADHDGSGTLDFDEFAYMINHNPKAAPLVALFVVSPMQNSNGNKHNQDDWSDPW
jgi:Ca2+-binding EF-hand superfamily protein